MTRPSAPRASLAPTPASIDASERAGADSDAWSAHYEQLLRFALENGHCNVPSGVIRDGLRLGAWLNGQRNRLRASATRPNGMNAAREEKLMELVRAGKLWIESPARREWHDMMDTLERWAKATNGGRDYNCPHDLTYEDRRVGAWLTTQRMRYRSGERARTPLKPEQRARMDALCDAGKLWLEKEDLWGAKFDAMMRWSAQHTGGKHCNVPFDCEYEGHRLGAWLNTQRQRYRGNTTKNFKLSDEQKTKLERLIADGRLWISQPQDLWEQKFALLLEWGKEKNGGEHYNIPQGEDFRDVKLGAWLGTQRQRMVGKGGKSKPLTNEQRRALQKLVNEGKLKPPVERKSTEAVATPESEPVLEPEPEPRPAKRKK